MRKKLIFFESNKSAHYKRFVMYLMPLADMCERTGYYCNCGCGRKHTTTLVWGVPAGKHDQETRAKINPGTTRRSRRKWNHTRLGHQPTADTLKKHKDGSVITYAEQNDKEMEAAMAAFREHGCDPSL
jgi:hypothetical protein